MRRRARCRHASGTLATITRASGKVGGGCTLSPPRIFQQRLGSAQSFLNCRAGSTHRTNRRRVRRSR
eukprot:2670772-Pleurochrysis_carterae.AAC.1